MNRFWLSAALGFAMLPMAFGQENRLDKTLPEVKVFGQEVSHFSRFQYLLHLPSGYEKSSQERWPLVVYLHGGSARGSDINLLKRYGPPMLAERGKTFPFILLAPQCPDGEIWTDSEGLMALIDSVARSYRVDESRIYLTGFSLGGRGVLYLSYKYPARFAAVAALAPYIPVTAWSTSLTATPLLIMHGDKDPLAPVVDSKELVAAMQQKGDVDLMVLPGRDHFITDIYEKDEIYTWLLKHRRQTVQGPR